MCWVTPSFWKKALIAEKKTFLEDSEKWKAVQYCSFKVVCGLYAYILELVHTSYANDIKTMF